MPDDRRLIDDAPLPAVVGGRDGGEDTIRRTAARLLHCLAEHCSGIGFDTRFEPFGLDPEVETLQCGHREEIAERDPVTLRRGHCRSRALPATQAAYPSRDDDARDQSLHVPLPRSERDLVEIVQVEHDPPFRRRD